MQKPDFRYRNKYWLMRRTMQWRNPSGAPTHQDVKGALHSFCIVWEVGSTKHTQGKNKSTTRRLIMAKLALMEKKST